MSVRRCPSIGQGARSGPAVFHTPTLIVLFYTHKHNGLFQICRTATRGSTPNARKHNDIVAAIVRDGQFSEERALKLSEVNGKVVTSQPCLLQMHMRRSS